MLEIFAVKHYVFIEVLKEYAHKDYVSFQKIGVGETNILKQIL